MRPLVTATLSITALLAGLDWVAVGTGRRRVEAVAKPAVMVGLMATAAGLVTAGPADRAGPDGGVALLVLLGLLAGLAGDVLLLPQVDRFVPGLVAFLIGHLAYLAAFLRTGPAPLGLAGGAVVALALLLGAGRPILAAVRRDRPSLAVPVGCYLVVIGAMLTAAIGSGPVAAACGAMLFAVSDAVLGWTRFVRPIPGQRLLVMCSYHLGQVLIVLGLLG